MYSAYRKAKVDVFYERSQSMATAFSNYEKSLHTNLSKLAARLNSGKPNWPKDRNFIGSFGYIPKGLSLPTSVSDPPGKPHFSFSDPDESWKHMLKRCGENKPTVEFRPVAHFSVDMNVTCALWVNLVGHKYDACLEECAYGSRLRRLRGDADARDGIGAYHEQAPGSFKPYFYCYREWRERGLKAIRDELTAGRRVVAITMDLAGFYHNVDPRFLLEPEFLRRAGFRRKNDGLDLSEEERAFTKQLVTAFESWTAQIPTTDDAGPPGVPVGASAPRIIANVLLTEFDRLVLKNLLPIYYGRYVDDIFLVLRDTGQFSSPDKVISYLVRRIRSLKLNDERTELRLVFPYLRKSRLLFKTEKQRIFLLGGEIGEDLLDAIESKIDEVSSEWRLLPNLDDLERSPAARVLTAARKSEQEVDALRKADELSLRRLGFSLLLRSVSALVRDLPPIEWVSERRRFYRFVERHVLTPLRILDLNDYLPGLLGTAVACRDWAECRGIVTRIKRSLDTLRSNVVLRPDEEIDAQWRGFFDHLKRSLIEAVLRSCPVTSGRRMAAAVDRVIREINALSPAVADIFQEPCIDRARDLFLSDLSRSPFKEVLLDPGNWPTAKTSFDISQLPNNQKKRADDIFQFVSKFSAPVGSLLPLLFPTRPLSAPELTELCPKTVWNLGLLRELVQAFRGTWVSRRSGKETEGDDKTIVEIGTS